MPLSITADPSTLVMSTPIPVIITGSAGTDFTEDGSVSLELDGGIGASIVSHAVVDATHLNVQLNPGSAFGQLTLTNFNSNNSVNATVVVQVISAVASRYATITDLYDRWGPDAVRILSNRGGAPNGPDYKRIQRGLDTGDAYINMGLYGGPYTLPLTSMDPYTTIIVRDMAVLIATSWLYKFRQAEAEDDLVMDLDKEMSTVLQDLRVYRDGQLKQLNAAYDPSWSGTASAFRIGQQQGYPMALYDRWAALVLPFFGGVF